MKHLKLFNSITESSSPSLTPQQKLDSFIVNLFGQVIFESNETLKESISKLPNEYKGQILIWRIYSDYYDKIETGIFVKSLE